MNLRLVVAAAYFKKKSTLQSRIDLLHTVKVSSFTSANIVYSHEAVASVEIMNKSINL